MRVLTAAKFDDRWHYFETEDHIWVQDWRRLRAGFVRRGHAESDLDPDAEERFGIQVLDEHNVLLLMSNLQSRALREVALDTYDAAEQLAYKVDFDNQVFEVLIDVGTNPLLFLPSGWTGARRSESRSLPGARTSSVIICDR